MNLNRLAEDSPGILLQRLVKIAFIRIDREVTDLKMLFARMAAKEGFVLRRVQGSLMFLNLADSGISSDLFLRGKREDAATDEFHKRLKYGMVVADIGANIGYYALMEARAVWTKGLVYAIEPITENIALLKRNIKVNGYKNIKTFNKAVGEKNCKKNIFLSNHSNLSTFCKNVKLNQTGKTIPVDVVSFDSFIKGKRLPDIIRMDVEGYEYEILKGMKKTLKIKNLQFFFEVHADFMGEKKTIAFLKILKQNGFSKCKIIKESRDVLKIAAKILSKKVLPEQGEFDKTIEEMILEESFHKGLYYLFIEKIKKGHC